MFEHLLPFEMFSETCWLLSFSTLICNFSLIWLIYITFFLLSQLLCKIAIFKSLPYVYITCLRSLLGTYLFELLSFSFFFASLDKSILICPTFEGLQLN
jgi:ABC-type multidrug transport system permease subunit